MVYPTIGDLRRKRRLTQREAALSLGLKVSTLANYETGRRTPSITDALAIARFYRRDPRKIDWGCRSRIRKNNIQEVS